MTIKRLADIQREIHEWRKGNAYRTEADRRVHAAADQSALGQSESPIYQAVQREARYTGLSFADGSRSLSVHTRFKNAAMRNALTKALDDGSLRKCFIGYRFHAMRYAYER